MKRTIFIGDIHGCYYEFRELIKKIKINEEDKIYIVGDFLNKGPYSYKVLKFLYKNKNQYKAIIGNHELDLLKYIDGDILYKEDSYKKLKKKLNKKPELLKYLRELPFYIEEDEFIMIHGGLNPNKSLEEQTHEEITHIRSIFGKPWYELYTGSKKIIYGHWALNGLNIYKNTIGLDTGCVYGKALTAYTLESGEITQILAHELYIDVFSIYGNNDKNLK